MNICPQKVCSTSPVAVKNFASLLQSYFLNIFRQFRQRGRVYITVKLRKSWTHGSSRFPRVRVNSLPTIWMPCTTIWKAGKGYKRSSNLYSPAMCVRVACFTLGLLRVVCLFSLFIPLPRGKCQIYCYEKYERKVKIGSSIGKQHIADRGKKRNVSLHKKYGNVYFIN